jgi:hypothetical protein
MPLPTNIRQDWIGSRSLSHKHGLGRKGLPVTNTLAYYEHLYITDVIFYKIGPWCLSMRKCVYFVENFDQINDQVGIQITIILRS